MHAATTDTACAHPQGFPVVAAAASVLVHAITITILLNTPLRPPVPAPENPVITMRLVPAPSVEAPAPAGENPPPAAPDEPAADATRSVEPATETASVPDPVDEPVDEPVDAIDADQPATADTRSNAGAMTASDPARAGELRATLLDQVRTQPAEGGGEDRNALPWPSSGAPVPGMPGVRGWISAYVGTVTPTAHTWKENDGSSRGRYVLADGTVICTRRRAPTIDEMMNPWKSIAVTMASICGRERPEAPDFSDPRVQPPPMTARQPRQNGG